MIPSNKGKKFISEMRMPSRGAPAAAEAGESEDEFGEELFPSAKGSEDADSADAGPLAAVSDSDLLREAQKRGLEVRMPASDESEDEADDEDMADEELDLEAE